MDRIVFIRALDHADKAQALKDARDGGLGASPDRMVLSESELRAVPLTPFAYWLSPRSRALFTVNDLTAGHVQTRVGMSSLDDFRFVRHTWEVRPDPARWPRYARGESQRPYVDTSKYVVKWAHDGAEVKAYVADKVGSASRKIQAETFYFTPGLTWVRRTSRLRMRCLPAGFIFSGGAQAAFAIGGTDDERLGFLGLANSTVFDSLIKVSVGRTGDAVQFESGMIDRAPWPATDRLPAALGALAREMWAEVYSMEEANEVSHAFVRPSVLGPPQRSFADAATEAVTKQRRIDERIDNLECRIDALCSDLYGLSDDDASSLMSDSAALIEDNGADGDVSEAHRTAAGDESLAGQLVSWAVGVAVGRFDVRLATGGIERAQRPGPFDALRPYQPAELVHESGSPAESMPAGYPLEVSPVLVSDRGHPLDIAARVRAVLDLVLGDHADAWWGELGSALDEKGSVDSWLDKYFFGFHLDLYSVPRSRKAPILWPIGTKSGSYLVWLYAPRITRDSLFTVLHDVVAPKLALEQQRLTQLRQDGGAAPVASLRREIDMQAGFVDELQEFSEAIESLAPLWAPDLNDGVVVALCPLWSLFAHHRQWSRELGSHWAKLVRGEYDWAQLAMHLAPERVVSRCAGDRSLAIAHRLDDVFWVRDQTNDDKWQARTQPTTSVDELVQARQDPAVAAALVRVS
jgi:hypothetical protein